MRMVLGERPQACHQPKSLKWDLAPGLPLVPARVSKGSAEGAGRVGCEKGPPQPPLTFGSSPLAAGS